MGFKRYTVFLLLVGGNAIGIKFKSNLVYNVGVKKHLRGKYLAGFIFLKQIHKYREVVFYSDPRAKRSSLLSIGTWDVSIDYDFHGTVRGRLQEMSWTHRSRFIQILRAIAYWIKRWLETMHASKTCNDLIKHALNARHTLGAIRFCNFPCLYIVILTIL